MQNCDECTKSRQWRNTGKLDKFGAVLRRCANCGNVQAEPPPQGLEKYPKSILYYDIETTKMTVETFGLVVPSKRLHYTSIKDPPILLCWSAAWVSRDKPTRVLSGVLTPKEAQRRDDRRCLGELKELMNRADYWVGHNSKSFDTKKTLLFFLLRRMGSPDLTVKQEDTLKLARKYFKNDSDTLAYWLQRFGRAGKDKMESEDWDLCKAGDQKALNKMRKYNKQDVRGGIEVLIEFWNFLESGGIKLFK